MIEKDVTFRREELEKLSTPELDMILRSELDSDTPQRETVLFVLSILEDRDLLNSNERPEGAEEAWERLLNRPQGSARTHIQFRRKPAKWLGTVAAAMLAVVLLLTVPQSVGAENIFQIIGRWTRDIFNLSDGLEEQIQDDYVFQTDHEGLQQLYDAVIAQGITDLVVPMWLPEGYELTELQLSPESKRIYARYCYGECYVQITIKKCNEDSSYKYTKDDNDVEILEIMNQQYYIMPNVDIWKAVWKTDNNLECYIITNDTEEVLKTIIKSIHGDWIYEKIY